ncbi:MAG: hypothetical protein U5K28_10515 [Halobacteriales archaeon]|nr:hypothetical protein [Halobacteriales archaeon]
MGTVSARLSDDIEAELESYLDAEGVDRSTAVRQLLAEQLSTWRQERAVEKLARGEITLSAAAEMAGVDVWTLAALARERERPWVDSEGIEADIESFDA